ncbi:DUF3341 domain-containing protein [soil metagenome]
MSEPRLYGILAEFDTPTELTHAAHAAHEAGYRRMDGYSPFPIEELPEALGKPKTRIAYVVLAGGLFGCIGGYLLQYWSSTIAYPLNIGGRPFHSWPSFIPVTFECTILGAALSGVFGMLALNGLPRPHHPLFAISRFGLATRDRFFLCIEARDKKFDRQGTAQFLAGLHAHDIVEVPLD